MIDLWPWPSVSHILAYTQVVFPKLTFVTDLWTQSKCNGYRNSQHPSVRLSFRPSKKKVLLQPQFFTDLYHIFTASSYHWKFLLYVHESMKACGCHTFTIPSQRCSTTDVQLSKISHQKCCHDFKSILYISFKCGVHIRIHTENILLSKMTLKSHFYKTNYSDL